MPGASRLLDLNYRAYERRIASNPLVILPVGALEAHGPHLPLGADQIQAEATAFQLAERLDALVAPAVPYGVTPGASRFPGTLSLSIAALEEHVAGVVSELARNGVRRLLILSGHGERGHIAALREAAERAMRSFPRLRVVVLCDYDFVYELRGKDAPASDGHAGALETSRMLALVPETVGPERPVGTYRHSPFVPGPASEADWPECVIGDTRPANAELGRKVQEHVLERLTSTVQALLPP